MKSIMPNEEAQKDINEFISNSEKMLDNIVEETLKFNKNKENICNNKK